MSEENSLPFYLPITKDYRCYIVSMHISQKSQILNIEYTREYYIFIK